MASITNRPNGHRWIQFKGLNGKRQTVRLGQVSRACALAVKERVERLLAAKAMEMPIDLDTARWLAAIGDELHARIAACGLIASREVPTLAKLLEDFESSLEVGHSTTQNIAVILGNLRTFWDDRIDLRDIQPADAKAFRAWMLEHGGVHGGPLAPTTVSRRARRARQVFKHAVDREWLKENPFAGMGDWNEANRDKDFFVSREIVEAILEEITHPEFRAIVALARFGGLRCPSEILPLRWSDVDWRRQELSVAAVKTKTTRVVPLFPEVRLALEILWEQTPTDQARLFEKHQVSGSGLTGKLQLACRRAGVPTWPKAWQNMRATRETELLDEYPSHVVFAWIGHSATVSRKHYAQITKEHHAKAVGVKLGKPGETTPNVLRVTRSDGGPEVKPEAP